MPTRAPMALAIRDTDGQGLPADLMATTDADRQVLEEGMSLLPEAEMQSPDVMERERRQGQTHRE